MQHILKFINMSTVQHNAVSGYDIHAITAFTFASAAARNSQAVVAGDIGKVAHITADNSFYVLTAVAPAVWSPLGGTGSGTTITAVSQLTNDSGYQTAAQVAAATVANATNATNVTGGTAGAILYQSASNTTAKLSIGTNGQMLSIVNGTPAWTAAPTGGATGPAEAGTLTGSTLAANVTTSSLTSVGTLNTLSVTGAITTGGMEVGTKVMPQSIKSTDYTAQLTDNGGHIFHPSADLSTRTWTIPANNVTAFPIGTALMFINQNNAGVITIVCNDTMRLAGVGTTGPRTLAANGMATAIKVTSTEWLISGTNLS